MRNNIRRLRFAHRREWIPPKDWQPVSKLQPLPHVDVPTAGQFEWRSIAGGQWFEASSEFVQAWLGTFQGRKAVAQYDMAHYLAHTPKPPQVPTKAERMATIEGLIALAVDNLEVLHAEKRWGLDHTYSLMQERAVEKHYTEAIAEAERGLTGLQTAWAELRDALDEPVEDAAQRDAIAITLLSGW